MCDRALYGPQQVEAAHERGAVQTLLISDKLFRSSDLQTRQRYVHLVEDVQNSGCEALIFSSMHLSGERKTFTRVNNRIFSSSFLKKERLILLILLHPFPCEAELNQLSGIAAILSYPCPDLVCLQTYLLTLVSIQTLFLFLSPPPLPPLVFNLLCRRIQSLKIALSMNSVEIYLSVCTQVLVKFTSSQQWHSFLVLPIIWGVHIEST